MLVSGWYFVFGISLASISFVLRSFPNFSLLRYRALTPASLHFFVHLLYPERVHKLVLLHKLSSPLFFFYLSLLCEVRYRAQTL
ncbi:hypothetical protein EDB85DRAFT_2134444 [Lactarius pseudohatsudake]|nr:hypothetical protein EDB85DRAFT_2134444 [Lactarius pseudohatsudake]